MTFTKDIPRHPDEPTLDATYGPLFEPARLSKASTTKNRLLGQTGRDIQSYDAFTTLRCSQNVVCYA